jgi:hypothetical protein
MHDSPTHALVIQYVDSKFCLVRKSSRDIRTQYVRMPRISRGPLPRVPDHRPRIKRVCGMPAPM